MRRRLTALLPPLVCAAAVFAFFGRLASPSAVLAVRDIPLFHLPLRTVFAELAREGLPAWNPLINGGQPILSNPNYAAFYPPTWLALALPPHTAINLVILLHAAFGFAGAWRLARRLGCERPAAAFTAIAFTGGGAFVASASSLTSFCGLAWLPWLLTWGDGLFDREDPRPWPRRALALGAGLALQFLAGEPVVVLTSGAGLACLALARSPRGPTRRLAGLAAAALLATLFAAVQLLPTLGRLADSPRARGLGADEATVWSLPPARAVELLLPRFYGDPMRGDENLYFGWGLHDRDYPYLISIYPGTLVLVLALAALLRWPIPRRGAWAAMLAAGLFLALGRNNPVYAALADLVPLLGAIRYPEKFLLLATSGLAFAAGLGWQHLLERKRRGRPESADLPLALAAVAVACAAVFATALWLRPEVSAWFVRRHTVLPATAELLERALAYQRGEAAAALAVAVAAALALVALRLRRLPAGVAALAALGVLAADLHHYQRGLTPTVPIAELARPPALAAALAGPPSRLFTDVGLQRESSFVLRSPRPGPDRLWTSVERLDPYVGNLWGRAYALNEDFDLMLTGPARSALELLHRVRDRPHLARALVGAWSAGDIVQVRTVAAALGDRLRGEPGEPARRLPNPDYLPPFRFPRRVELHPNAERAVAAAIDGGLRLGEVDHWVGRLDGGAPPPPAAAGGARLLKVEARGRAVRIRYRAATAAALTAAVTFDRGWRATVDGERLSPLATAAGQIGLVLPPGERTVELVFWERGVGVGAAVSAAALIAALVALLVGRRRRAFT